MSPNPISERRSQLIDRLPKAELHLHIEGSLEPEMMFALAKRNGITIPFTSVENIREAYTFSNLQDFLNIYYQGMNVLQTEQDFYDLTYAYLKRANGDQVCHVEIFFDPQGHTDRGIAFSEVIQGILRALKAGEEDFGITYRLIMCFLRHLDEESAFATLREAEPWLDRITGIGLDSSEVGHPPSKFAKVFTEARQLGLKVVAHAGEEGPPEYVWEALDLLKVNRIDHGNRAMEDPSLIKRIVTDAQTLTVCPLSNLRLRVIKKMEDSPIKKMLEQGIRATVHSDDPAYFGGYINDNFKAVAEALDLSIDQVIKLAANSFTGSFLPDSEKQMHLYRVEEVGAEFR